MLKSIPLKNRSLLTLKNLIDREIGNDYATVNEYLNFCDPPFNVFAFLGDFVTVRILSQTRCQSLLDNLLSGGDGSVVSWRMQVRTMEDLPDFLLTLLYVLGPEKARASFPNLCNIWNVVNFSNTLDNGVVCAILQSLARVVPLGLWIKHVDDKENAAFGEPDPAVGVFLGTLLVLMADRRVFFGRDDDVLNEALVGLLGISFSHTMRRANVAVDLKAVPQSEVLVSAISLLYSRLLPVVGRFVAADKQLHAAAARVMGVSRMDRILQLAGFGLFSRLKAVQQAAADVGVVARGAEQHGLDEAANFEAAFCVVTVGHVAVDSVASTLELYRPNSMAQDLSLTAEFAVPHDGGVFLACPRELYNDSLCGRGMLLSLLYPVDPLSCHASPVFLNLARDFFVNNRCLFGYWLGCVAAFYTDDVDFIRRIACGRTFLDGKTPFECDVVRSEVAGSLQRVLRAHFDDVSGRVEVSSQARDFMVVAGGRSFVSVMSRLLVMLFTLEVELFDFAFIADPANKLNIFLRQHAKILSPEYAELIDTTVAICERVHGGGEVLPSDRLVFVYMVTLIIDCVQTTKLHLRGGLYLLYNIDVRCKKDECQYGRQSPMVDQSGLSNSVFRHLGSPRRLPTDHEVGASTSNDRRFMCFLFGNFECVHKNLDPAAMELFCQHSLAKYVDRLSQLDFPLYVAFDSPKPLLYEADCFFTVKTLLPTVDFDADPQKPLVTVSPLYGVDHFAVPAIGSTEHWKWLDSSICNHQKRSAFDAIFSRTHEVERKNSNC